MFLFVICTVARGVVFPPKCKVLPSLPNVKLRSGLVHSFLSNLISLLSATQVCSPSHVGLLSVLHQGFWCSRAFLWRASFTWNVVADWPQINLENLQATALQPHGLGLPSSREVVCVFFPAPTPSSRTCHSFASPLYVMFLTPAL